MKFKPPDIWSSRTILLERLREQAILEFDNLILNYYGLKKFYDDMTVKERREVLENIVSDLRTSNHYLNDMTEDEFDGIIRSIYSWQ